MIRKPCLIAPLSVAGTMAGFLYGRSQASSLWPELSGLHTMRYMAFGWLGGLAVAALMTLVWRSRGTPAGRPSGFVRAGRLVAIILALSPGALWATALLPGSPLRPVMRVAWPTRGKGPNIVLISIDALRADHLGAYGSGAGLTPNLDAFAREATVYRSAVAPSPWTLASLGSAFSGLPPSRSTIVRGEDEYSTAYAGRTALLGSTVLAPEVLSRAGYRTAAELTNPFLAVGRGWERGYEYFRNEDGWDAATEMVANTDRAETVTEHAGTWLSLKRREPFFLWVHYLDPHGPYDSPDTPRALRGEYPSEWKTGRAYWYETMANAGPEERARFAEFCRRMYAEEVRYADRWVGELLADLKRRGLYDGAAIVITSDHGEELFEHGGFEHGHSMHEEVLHVPLLVKWPKGTAADRTITQTVSLESLGPTLLELAHVAEEKSGPAPALPRFEGGARTEVYSEAPLYGPDQTALTTDDYKVIYHLPNGDKGGSFEVYDRRADPGETRDLAAAGVAARERERLQKMTEEALATRAREGSEGLPKVELDQSAKRQLKSLGYLSD